MNQEGKLPLGSSNTICLSNSTPRKSVKNERQRPSFLRAQLPIPLSRSSPGRICCGRNHLQTGDQVWGLNGM